MNFFALYLKIKKFEEKVPTSHVKVHENTINQNEKPQRAEK